MPHDTISFAIDGDVTIETLEGAVKALRKLIQTVTQAVAPDASVGWILQKLDGGSMSIAFQARPSKPIDAAHVPLITAEYIETAQIVEKGELPEATDVIDAVEALLEQVQGDATVGRFGARGEEARVDLRNWQARSKQSRPRTVGSVLGVLEGVNLHLRHQHYATVSDERTGNGVRCFFDAEHQQILLDNFGERIYILGELTREAESGCKVEIRRIIRVERLPARDHYQFEKARGVAPRRPGDPPAENFIQGLRDAG